MHRLSKPTRTGAWAVVAGLALLAGARTAAAAEEPPITWEAFVTLSDPFAELNRKPLPDASTVTAPAGAAPLEVRRGEVFRIVVIGRPGKGWHTYPFTQHAEAQRPDSLNTLTLAASPNFKLLSPGAESEPVAVVENGDTLLEFNRPFLFTQEVFVPTDAKPGVDKVAFTVRFTVCNESQCLPPAKKNFEFPVRITEEEAAPAPADLGARLQGDRPQPPPAPADPVTIAAPAAPPTFFWQLVIAAGAGFGMLFTPCVFPMIPVTVSFFLKQGEARARPAVPGSTQFATTAGAPPLPTVNPLALAVIYSGTIIVVLTLAVLVLGKVIVDLANNPLLNLGMGLVLLAFALSLFGMFELELPGFLTRYTSSHEGQGYVGAFFMALTFTINSFTCTGPFLGPLLSGVKEFGLSFWQIALSALVYSAAFAGPFFVLALFPRLLKSLPKSGGWLNAVKVVMGFLEVGLALKFLSITDAGLHPGNPRLFTYDTVLCAWIALSTACALYLLGLFRLPHDSPLPHVGVPRLLLATLFFGLALYMTPLLWRKSPQGAVGEFLTAWLPYDSAPAGAGQGTGDTAHLDWTRDYEAAWKKARDEKKPLFIDFTGLNCQNCRYNELNVFSRAEVRQQLEPFVRVQLYTDFVPGLERRESEAVAERQRDWQDRTFRDVALPLYAVIDPSTAEKPFTDDGRLAGTVRFVAKGQITDVAGFVKGLSQSRTQQQVAAAR